MTNKRWWMGAAVLVLAASAWMFYDEPLQPEAQAWLDAVQARSQGGSAAYELLLGLDAPLAQDPRERGRQRLAEYTTRAPASAFFETPPAVDPRLTTAGLDRLCAPAEARCFERFGRDPEQAQRLLDEHGVLLQRYREALNLGDFRSLARPGADEPLPAYGVMLKGNRLLALQALLLAHGGDGNGARRLLEDDLRQLRRQLADSDQLVGKMTWVHLVAANLELLARLRAEGRVARLSEQPALSVQERDLLPVLQREFAGKASYFLGLANASYAQAEFSPGALETLYKPRQSVNLIFAQDRLVAEVAALDAAAFAQDSRLQAVRPHNPWLHPNNPIGVILANIAGPSMDSYIARLHDLDAKLRLFNLLGRLPAGESPSPSWLAGQAEAGNSYEPDALPEWRERSGQLCFSGPLEDSRGLRCITVRSNLLGEIVPERPPASAP